MTILQKSIKFKKCFSTLNIHRLDALTECIHSQWKMLPTVILLITGSTEIIGLQTGKLQLKVQPKYEKF